MNTRNPRRQRLVRLFDGMNDQQRQSLLDYAEFLQQRAAADNPEQTGEKHKPLESTRPDNENVVNAIKRLRASYYMINTDDLLNESSALMAQFMIQGRSADEVIDDLETVFENHYRKYLEG